MSEASLETRRYLDQIGSRIKTYHNTMNRAKEFIFANGIYDNSLAMECIVMSLLWVSAVRGEQLTEEELFMFLGLETELADDKTITFADSMKDWGLEEVLKYVVDNY